jgi:hypothetical protein
MEKRVKMQGKKNTLDYYCNTQCWKNSIFSTVFNFILVYWLALRNELISIFLKCKRNFKCIKNVLTILDLTNMKNSRALGLADMKDPSVYPGELGLIAISDPIFLSLAVMHSCQTVPGSDTKYSC